MVGIGKGILPLIGFPQGRAIEKQKSSDVGLISLFFGYQNEPEFIDNDIIQELKRGGMLKLYLALSRSPGAPKRYVQNNIELLGEEAAKMLMDPNVPADSCCEALVR
jgi:sulfite reductase alpha subunit-like flavoprotein